MLPAQNNQPLTNRRNGKLQAVWRAHKQICRPAPTRAELEAMPVRALLALLAARGVSAAGAAEKADLVALALR